MQKEQVGKNGNGPKKNTSSDRCQQGFVVLYNRASPLPLPRVLQEGGRNDESPDDGVTINLSLASRCASRKSSDGKSCVLSGELCSFKHRPDSHQSSTGCSISLCSAKMHLYEATYGLMRINTNRLDCLLVLQ
jgi:hypothetical protein